MKIAINEKEYNTESQGQFTLTEWLLDIIKENPTSARGNRLFEDVVFGGTINMYCSYVIKEKVIKDYVEWRWLNENPNHFDVLIQISAIKLAGYRINIYERDIDYIIMEYVK